MQGPKDGKNGIIPSGLSVFLTLRHTRLELGKTFQIGVGQKKRSNIIVHVGGCFRQLEVGHFFGNLRHVSANVIAEGTHLGTHQGSIADKGNFPGIHFGQETDDHGFFQVHITAEPPCQDDLLQILNGHADLFEQGHTTAVDSAFGPDEIFDVDFRQNDITIDLRVVFPCQDVFIDTFFFTYSRRVQIAIEFTEIVDNSVFEQCCHHDNETGPADALGSDIADADVHGFEGIRVDGKIFDGAFGGPHAEFDTATFKCRSGRTGCTGEPFVVADDDFGIGSDIHKERQLVCEIHAGTHDTGDNITADVARYRWIDQRTGMFVQFDPDIDRLDGRVERCGGHVGRAPDIPGIDL